MSSAASACSHSKPTHSACSMPSMPPPYPVAPHALVGMRHAIVNAGQGDEAVVVLPLAQRPGAGHFLVAPGGGCPKVPLQSHCR